MKKSIALSILIVLVILVIVLVSLFYYYKKVILNSDEKQVEALINIYEDFLKNKLDNNENIILDKTCLINLITKSEFSDQNKEILKEIEVKNDNINYYKYVLYSSFDSKNLILILNLRRDDGNFEQTQKYKLYVRFNKIVFERYGLGTTFNARPVN